MQISADKHIDEHRDEYTDEHTGENNDERDPCNRPTRQNEVCDELGGTASHHANSTILILVFENTIFSKIFMHAPITYVQKLNI